MQQDSLHPSFFCKPSDGLCQPALTLKARQLLSTVCVQSGLRCPLMPQEEALELLNRIRQDPTLSIRLTSDADLLPVFKRSGDAVYPAQPPAHVFNRKRDLDVLRELGLLPGDTRRARYLYETLFERIETLDGICAYDTPGWEGCAFARSGSYEAVRAQGWQAMVYARSSEEMKAYRERNIAEIRQGNKLFMRPHHLLCLSCWYAGGEGQGPRPNDALSEILERIRENPNLPIVLIEGCCEACDSCDGFHPDSGRCVHSCGLIRDYKKDLDVFQKLGLMPGAALTAREAIHLLFDRILSTREICGYNDSEETCREWRICGDPNGNPGYEKTRKIGLF